MRKLRVAFVAAVVFAGCASVEDKDAKCQHIGSQPHAAVSGDDAVWFKNNCVCEENLVALSMMGILPPLNACYFPGSKHHHEVLDFLKRAEVPGKKEKGADTANAETTSSRPLGAETPDFNSIKQGEALCRGRPIDKVKAHMDVTRSLLTQAGEGTCGGGLGPTGVRIERWTCFTQTWSVPAKNGRPGFQALLVFSESAGPGKGWFLSGLNWQKPSGDEPVEIPVCDGVEFAR